jgi:hypothetical protein
VPVIRAALPLAGLPFELQPFGGAATRAALGLDGLTLRGSAGRERRPGTATLVLGLELRQPAWPVPGAELLLLPPADPAARRDGLWRHTCLEAFVAAAERPSYWEINLAPSGDWALYRFEGYRLGQIAPAREPPWFTVIRSGGGLTLQLRWPLPAELVEARELALAVTAVLEQPGGRFSYWALHHPGPEPDFHHRDGFLLEL